VIKNAQRAFKTVLTEEEAIQYVQNSASLKLLLRPNYQIYAVNYKLPFF